MTFLRRDLWSFSRIPISWKEAVLGRWEGLVPASSGFAVNDLVESILNQGEADDSKTEDGQDEIKDGGVVVVMKAALILRLIDGFSYLVEPVEGIDSAADDREEKCHSAGSGSFAPDESMGVICGLIDPVEKIDTAGHDGKDDGEGDSSFFDGVH